MNSEKELLTIAEHLGMTQTQFLDIIDSLQPCLCGNKPTAVMMKYYNNRFTISCCLYIPEDTKMYDTFFDACLEWNQQLIRLRDE